MEQSQPVMSTARVENHASTPPTPLRISGLADANLAEIAHEARNMVAALGLYCDLLEEPGVFAEPYRHYGDELRLVASASRGLVNRLLTLSAGGAGAATGTIPSLDSGSLDDIAWPEGITPASKAAHYWEELSPSPINDLAWEIRANYSLLAALAGPSIALSVDTAGGALPVRLSSEDLTRILVNLVKNSVEATPGTGGSIRLVLRECLGDSEEETRLLLNIEDNGTGIPPGSLERIFDTGFTTRPKNPNPADALQSSHRGLGLSITRSIVESAGGSVRAANRDPMGTCIQVELPVRTA